LKVELPNGEGARSEAQTKAILWGGLGSEKNRGKRKDAGESGKIEVAPGECRLSSRKEEGASI